MSKTRRVAGESDRSSSAPSDLLHPLQRADEHTEAGGVDEVHLAPDRPDPARLRSITRYSSSRSEGAVATSSSPTTPTTIASGTSVTETWKSPGVSVAATGRGYLADQWDRVSSNHTRVPSSSVSCPHRRPARRRCAVPVRRSPRGSWGGAPPRRHRDRSPRHGSHRCPRPPTHEHPIARVGMRS